MSKGWTPEGLRKMANDPHQYADQLADIAYHLADAIEATFQSRSFTKVFEPEEENEV